jgi:outer membrane protein assembly factor BamB
MLYWPFLLRYAPHVSEAGETSTDGDSLSRPVGSSRRWRWLAAWLLLLTAICTAAWYAVDDRGVKNSVVYAAIGLAILGTATWIARSPGLPRAVRWGLAALLLLMPAAVMLQFSPIELVMDGNMTVVDWRWRWEEPDVRLAAPKVAKTEAIDWRETAADYPRFLGNGYWAEVEGVELETDWEQHRPKQLWKREIGAGWSSFAIVGDYAVTQEQRGDAELVVCYELRTGQIAWTHSDPIRWDPIARGSLGGVGPRATPTVHEGKVFTHGATGIVNCLDARTGELVWTHNTLEENGAEPVMWGKANSPLVVDDAVVISVGGTSDASLVAYDIETGEKRWSAGRHRSSYASPVLAELAGVRQIVSVNENYVTAHDPSDGRQLWEFEWKGDSDTDATASQPVPVGGDRVFLSKGYGGGAELIQVERGEGGKLAATSVWKNRSVMRTKMCNVVIHDGYVYGLNEGIQQCIELETGRSQWKKRRSPEFGHGQILLVGDVILLLSEHGELILFDASPEKYRERASLQALEGITWNNPALAGNVVLVRNATEAAAFELPLRGQDAMARLATPQQ